MTVYKMTISRLTVDKLGVKLYDKVSAVIAELIANGYDADASCVRVRAPMDQLLATRNAGKLIDKGLEIVVADDGAGMTPDEINDFYLKVGGERRTDPRRGDTSKSFHRKVMGRKGVGKLAPFGICDVIEVLSSGGKSTKGTDESGKSARGYLTAHFFLEKAKILTDSDSDYKPRVGKLNGIVRPARGTTLTLTKFAHRHVPSIGDFERQLSQRFGIASSNWKIELIDNTKTTGTASADAVVGQFAIEKMEGTEIRFQKNGAGNAYVAIDHDGNETSEIKAGFSHEGTFYPLTGWAAYAKQPYKDDLMAGVRVYCNGKIAAQTGIFNFRAGFHGEYDIRSYLVGELHADWLDADEDLIQTDRRDILWSHELGQAFEQWGQALVLLLGKKSRQPLKKKVWERFLEISKLVTRVDKAFPSDDQKEIRDRAMGFAKLVGQNLREGELADKEHVESLVQLSLQFAPHITLDSMLRQAAEDTESPLSAVTTILKTARIAELSSFGQIASERLRVIHRIEALKDDGATLEDALQQLIAEAPWLVDPQWAPIIANQSFSTLKSEFQKFYKKQTGNELVLQDFTIGNKRCDFVMANFDGSIQIVEIKPPQHVFDKNDLERTNRYADLMDEFLGASGNEEFSRLFSNGFHITLVCDKLGLKDVAQTAFKGLQASGKLTHVTWTAFLLKTRRMHQDFLKEAEKQKRNAARA
jgi:uncharacterized protein (UPF0335 family)